MWGRRWGDRSPSAGRVLTSVILCISEVTPVAQFVLCRNSKMKKVQSCDTVEFSPIMVNLTKNNIFLKKLFKLYLIGKLCKRFLH